MLTLPLVLFALSADPAPTITSVVGTGEKGFKLGDGGLAAKAAARPAVRRGVRSGRETSTSRTRITTAFGESMRRPRSSSPRLRGAARRASRATQQQGDRGESERTLRHRTRFGRQSLHCGPIKLLCAQGGCENPRSLPPSRHRREVRVRGRWRSGGQSGTDRTRTASVSMAKGSCSSRGRGRAPGSGG